MNKQTDIRPWYSIRASASGEAELWIYDEIGEDFWGEGTSAKTFCRELAALDVERIALHINSPGGAVFDGQAIYNALRAHPATITTYIDGVAASIASVVALAGERVVMAENALFMIHEPYVGVIGTADELRNMAGLLDKISDSILAVYEAKTGAERETLVAAMAAETWYSAAEALEAGFVDEVAEPIRAAASFDLSAFRYRHVPAALLSDSSPERALAPAVAETVAAADAKAAQVSEPIPWGARSVSAFVHRRP